jgi:hypothetical protein
LKDWAEDCMHFRSSDQCLDKKVEKEEKEKKRRNWEKRKKSYKLKKRTFDLLIKVAKNSFDLLKEMTFDLLKFDSTINSQKITNL